MKILRNPWLGVAGIVTSITVVAVSNLTAATFMFLVSVAGYGVGLGVGGKR